MEFVPGLEVSRALYEESVGPTLRQRFPALRHAAGLVDGGSEVLGFDTARSMDHDWGARLQVFLDDDADPADAQEIEAVIGGALPATVRGVPARFGVADDTRLGVADPEGLRHDIVVVPLGVWLRGHLGFDPRDGVTTADWLGTPSQLLAVVTGGAVFHDDIGLGARPRAAAVVPGRPLALRPRRAVDPDRPGGAVRRAVRRGGRRARLGGRSPPGSPATTCAWRCCWPAATRRTRSGSAPRSPGCPTSPASRTSSPPPSPPPSGGSASATSWPPGSGSPSCTNATGLAAPVDPTPRPFHDRPFTVLDGERFAAALRDAVTDPEVRALPPTGTIDQYVDSTDVLAHTGRSRAAMGGLLADGRPNER